MENKIVRLAGKMPLHPHPLPLFSPIVLGFLQALSEEIRNNSVLQGEPLFAAFAFWLRRKHIEAFQATIPDWQNRLGRGLMFHITPTNIPVIFAYSLTISLLAGNNNIVRVSPRIRRAAAPLCQIIENIWSQQDFRVLGENNTIITYEKNPAIHAQMTSVCDGRIIWGGNASICEIRNEVLPPQAVELVFADRYSLAVFDAETLCQCTDSEMAVWAHRFYNDTYDMDQNACSSPQLIFWLAPRHNDIASVQQRWWQAVAQAATVYNLSPVKASGKYAQMWTYAMTCPTLKRIEQFDNLVYVYTLDALPKDITGLSGKFGQFFQFTIAGLQDFTPILNKKVQTISTLGLDRDKLRSAIIASGALGGDRIVAVGQAMEINVLWDGVNMLERLSRVIS
jgi:hypothetical protein